MFHVEHLLNQLTPRQRAQLREYERLFLRMNASLNLVSRPSAARFREEHVLDCLTFAQRRFPAGSVVVDWGAGGGLPTVPLAVVFPEVVFHAVDANRRKHYALRHFRRQLELRNLREWRGRAKAFPHDVDYSVSRATAKLKVLWGWHQRVARNLLATGPKDWRPGLICRKGSQIEAETDALHGRFWDLQVESIPVQRGLLVHVSPK